MSEVPVATMMAVTTSVMSLANVFMLTDFMKVGPGQHDSAHTVELS